MKKRQLNETFSGEVALVNDEALYESEDFSSVIDGKNIIGIVEGQFFQPDGMSRNKRWYSRKLWDNVLASPDVRNRLASRTMYGEIGHSDGPVTDMTLRDGSVSHIIADLWIDEKGRGMGRAYIIDTPKGRLLKTYLGAKSKLKVSTRGEGVYLDGETHDGYPIIDPDTYELQTVDFVLNPGFMETSAKLTTAQKEDFTPQLEQVNKATKKEGENRMDAEKYIQKLEDEIKELKTENKSLSEELKSKETALLESKFTESAEIKKISEAYAPFKKMGVSAKSLNETLKKAQTSLKKANEEKASLKEALKAYEDKCGSIEQVDDALKMSEKALNTIAEYQKLGTVAELKELRERSEALVPKLKQLSTLTEYRKLGSVEDFKNLLERCEKSLPKLKELSILEDYKKLGSVQDIQNLSKKCESMLPRLKKLDTLKEYEKLGSIDEIKSLTEKFEESLVKLKDLSILEDYKQLGSVKDIQTMAKKTEAMLPKLAQLKDARKLAESVKKLLPRLNELKEVKYLREATEKAHNVIQQYLDTVGSLNEAKALVESRKETIKTVNIKEAMTISENFGCTIESAAKLIKKYGADKATKLLESAVAKKNAKAKTITESAEEDLKPQVKDEVLAEGTDLIAEAEEMETVNAKDAKPETITAEKFIRKNGMVVNAFNLEAIGKELKAKDFEKLDGTKVDGENQAKLLLKQFAEIGKPEIEKAPKVDKPENPDKAEKIAKDLLK